jgi:hypothetical protein
VIIELREEKRMSEERIMEHFKECKPAIDNACASLFWCSIKIEKKCGFVETDEEFEKTNLVIEKDK